MRSRTRAAALVLAWGGLVAACSSAQPAAPEPPEPCVTNGGTCVPATDLVGCAVLLSYGCAAGESCCTLVDAGGGLGAGVGDAAGGADVSEQ